MNHVEGTAYFSNSFRMRGTPVRGSKRRSSISSRRVAASWGLLKTRPDSASGSTENTTAHCAPFGQRYRVTSSSRLQGTGDRERGNSPVTCHLSSVPYKSADLLNGVAHLLVGQE